ncbi:DUF3788 family protein [Brucepastera parasyntrophica]|uniref:DUF3788 domain-containing protein n=1 Tax=Brucepastera parasyntrophica TaxID=2880008 RepID=UPI00210C82D7|nr:DUF3788 domain-containing protein [Brucepastera parasyntrophica]ULQ58654.1 DUF3788 family protein [Brucepastera parasyntrophica]
MNNRTELEKVSEEIMRFMRGKYVLDEVPGKYYDIDCLKFRQGKKTILSINIHETHYDFQIILGKAEREKFEAQRSDFPKEIQDLYDRERTLHDGKWLLIRVEDLASLEAVKQLILIKKKPNRKPFPKKQAVYASCGHRCDLCAHYTGGTISEEFRAELKKRLIRVYAGGADDGGYWGDDMKLCDGCHTGGLDKSFNCDSLKCAAENGVTKCQNCHTYPCDQARHMYQGLKPKIHTNTITADDVTCVILPYVDGQYGN